MMEPNNLHGAVFAPCAQKMFDRISQVIDRHIAEKIGGCETPILSKQRLANAFKKIPERPTLTRTRSNRCCLRDPASGHPPLQEFLQPEEPPLFRAGVREAMYKRRQCPVGRITQDPGLQLLRRRHQPRQRRLVEREHQRWCERCAPLLRGQLQRSQIVVDVLARRERHRTEIGCGLPVHVGQPGNVAGAPVPERAPGRREDQPAHARGLAAAQRLPDGVVLGIDGQQHAIRCVHGIDQETAGADQRLLVRERHHGSAARCCKRRRQPREAHYRRHYPFGRTNRCLRDRVRASSDLDRRPGKRILESVVSGRIGNDSESGAQEPGLLGQQFDGTAGNQRFHPVSLRIARNEIDRVLSDGPGRTEDGYPARLRRRRRRPARHVHGHPGPTANLTSPTATSTAIRPSTRSSNPP